MSGVYLAGRAVQARTWQALALAPVRDYLAAWHAVAFRIDTDGFAAAGLGPASRAAGHLLTRPGHVP